MKKATKKPAPAKPVKAQPAFDQARMATATREFLDALAIEQPEFKDTPKRVAAMWRELLERHVREPEEMIPKTFPTTTRELVTIGPVYTHSMCPHHLLPSDVIAHVGFVPNGETAGLSHLAELVAMSCRRFALIENLADQIAEDIQRVLKPKGIAVHLTSRHGCVAFRAQHREETWFDAQAFVGSCDTPSKRREFFAWLQQAPK